MQIVAGGNRASQSRAHTHSHTHSHTCSYFYKRAIIGMIVIIIVIIRLRGVRSLGALVADVDAILKGVCTALHRAASKINRRVCCVCVCHYTLHVWRAKDYHMRAGVDLRAVRRRCRRRRRCSANCTNSGDNDDNDDTIEHCATATACTGAAKCISIQLLYGTQSRRTQSSYKGKCDAALYGVFINE